MSRLAASRKAMSPLQLPDEIVVHIMGFVDLVDLFVCRRVRARAICGMKAYLESNSHSYVDP
jgi:hypothetical protein